VQDILGLCEAPIAPPESLLNILLGLYSQAKIEKQYGQVDAIRRQLQQLGIALQDTPAGVQWAHACK
jgi:cysteinyl-tRNA synthetase